MIKRFLFLCASTLFFLSSNAQKADKIINAKEVTRIEKTLSADDMEGRRTFTPGIEKAADFIIGEFKKAGLQYWDGLKGYRQPFFMNKTESTEVTGEINGKPVHPEDVIAVGSETSQTINKNRGFREITIDSVTNFFRDIFGIMGENQPTIFWIAPKHAQSFKRLANFTNRPQMDGSASFLFVLGDKADQYSFNIKRKIEKSPLANVIGVIPGKSLKDEFVVFSAHYDHLGIGKPDAKGDSIYNGANDDASGTTAVILLAKYFKALNNNERTLIFVTFTGEEIGGFGSKYFSKQLDPDKVVAMFNLEMIGTDSKWGKNSAYITGYEKSDFGKILQKNLEGSQFRFEPDPYPKQNLFYRSDNATLAALGVPAHTISTSKMDNEPNYHKQSDEIETLDMNNMAEIIKSIAISSQSIISGKDTPSRVKKQE